ncbi:MAG: PmoA family protein [Planctomycetes bacterium]|nr:PmoA family protein [Planctomycetota bacterium]
MAGCNKWRLWKSPILTILLATVALDGGLQASESLPQKTHSQPSSAQAMLAKLGDSASGFAELRASFERRNAGHQMQWMPAAEKFECTDPAVVFVQSGTGKVQLPAGTSEFSVGDILCLKVGQTCSFNPPADLLIFRLPKPIAAGLPSLIRPDWDENITDTPGGCATEGDAYRRICLTWLGKNGPYLCHQINAHRVRIHDSFTHYHPIKGGFDEFYLVQEAPPGARLLVSEKLEIMLDPKGLTAEKAADLMREIPLHKNDLIYLPRGVVHRGLGGAVVQVITIPGFVPGAEIPVDEEIQSINRKLKLKDAKALPYHRGTDYVEMRSREKGETDVFIGGKPFTTLRMDRRLPDLWPLRNAAGQEVTRTWPRTLVVGEKQDHPHHQSLWFAHGEMNGIDFWHDSKAIVVQKSVRRHSDKISGWVESDNEWRFGESKIVATDRRRIRAFVDGDVRGLDFDITLTAGPDGLLFGDTKEGMFALRVAKDLVVDNGAELVNDRGNSGGQVWGKPARWILAKGNAGGKPAAVVMAGQRDNPRHPTHWHARKYGLLAANPFGLHDFTGANKGSGDLLIGAGASVRFRYRVLVFARHPPNEEIERLLNDYASKL